MKVTHLNTYTEGGAAEASLRLHVALLNAKLESKFIALYKARCTVKMCIRDRIGCIFRDDTFLF